MKQYVEVVVNVPIRRTFRPDKPPPELPGFEGERDAHSLGGGSARFQTFHYHLPPELVDTIQAGHLVWVPFGPQTVQGLVVRRTEQTPVATKPVDRMARPQPVLTPGQIELACWIADFYVAPLSEAIRLFVPPGLLHKSGDTPGVRVKREDQITLLIGEDEIHRSLLKLGRESKQVAVLETLLSVPGQAMAASALAKQCDLRTDSTLRTLAEKELIWRDKDKHEVVLNQARPGETGCSAHETEQTILALRGAEKYRPILKTLAEAGRPMWKSDLYAEVEITLSMLRDLQQAGLIRVESKVRYRDPLGDTNYPRSQPPTLTGEQEAVWEAISGQMFSKEDELVPGRFLLHGATGSGKTEIYLRAIAETLRRQRQAIVLVPEIALTPQTVARFAGRFPNRISVVHSELSVGERYDVWRRIRDDEIDVVIGPRSALFSPLPRLGLIIIDEEHESSYKQDAEEWGSFTVFYDARTVARKLAEFSNSGLILGSATPSLTSYHEATRGELALLEMSRRVMGHVKADKTRERCRESNGRDRTNVLQPTSRTPRYAEMPPVETVDMRQELRAGNRSIFSRALTSELLATLDAGEQAILFLNRRGSSTFVMCRDCGYVVECQLCDIPLTYHDQARVLICHHCNKRYPIPDTCPEPDCGSKRIKYFGSGTQRIVEQVRQHVPRARILRWDADTTGHKGSHQEILRQFSDHRADVLVGTQMIAKGLDLPLVTLVGVVSADVGLYLPDFRSPERTFQLLMQVAGRAGRSQRGGRVIFQSYTPEHYAIQAAAEHDYHAFYEREMAFRIEHSYPPLTRLARLVYWDKKLEKVKKETEQMAAKLSYRAEQLGLAAQKVNIMGPAPAFFARYRGYYRWQLVIRAPDPSAFLVGLQIPFGWRVDVDPVSLL